MNRNDPRYHHHDQLLLNAMLRQDLLSFITKCFGWLNPSQPLAMSWHLEALAYHLELVCLRQITRLIITVPPRHLKSISASVAFPAWMLGHYPFLRFVCASYSADLSEKHALDCRSIMNAPWYKLVFPRTRISREKNSVSDFTTTMRGGRLSTSVGGSLTGRGGQVLIIDDPMKPDEALSDARRSTANEWFDNTAYSRLDDKQHDAIIVVMQRLHMEDLVGHLLAKREGWVHLNLPAIAQIDERIAIGPGRFHMRKTGDLLQPKREPIEVLNVLREGLGNFSYSAQYLQTPIPIDGEIFKWGWFKPYDTAPARHGNDQVVQSWDTASKDKEINDFSVCTTWLVKDKTFYLLDVFRKRLNYPELRRAVIEHSVRWRPSAVLIEDKASGTALAQDFQGGELTGVYRPIAIEPEGDKITRAYAQSNAVEAGQVFIPRSAPWLADLRSEIVQFPSGRHDDQVDSIAQFLKWIRRPYDQAYLMPITGY